MEIYDIMGRRVALLANGRYEAGTHRVSFDASYLPSGLYLMRAQFTHAGESVKVITQKLTLMK